LLEINGKLETLETNLSEKKLLLSTRIQFEQCNNMTLTPPLNPPYQYSQRTKTIFQNSDEIKPDDRHDIPRHEVKRIICSLCDTEQVVQQNCINCGVCLGKYFCVTCKFFDDDISKQQYHCDECGICRTNGSDNFFHCKICGCCYSVEIKEGHNCGERAMHHNCPICFEYLFDTLREINVTIHFECVKEMEKHHRYSCPVCSKSNCDMSIV